jgi:hypothetical protein
VRTFVSFNKVTNTTHKQHKTIPFLFTKHFSAISGHLLGGNTVYIPDGSEDFALPITIKEYVGQIQL